MFFFFNDTATTEIYTLSLHDALPISQVRGGELHATGGARIGAHRARPLHRCLLCEPAEHLPRRLRHVFLREHDLQVSGAVAQHHEPDLPRRARGHHPTARGHDVTRECRQLLDAMEGGHGGGRLAVKGATRKWERGTEMPVPTSTFHVPCSRHPTRNNSNPRS